MHEPRNLGLCSKCHLANTSTMFLRNYKRLRLLLGVGTVSTLIWLSSINEAENKRRGQFPSAVGYAVTYGGLSYRSEIGVESRKAGSRSHELHIMDDSNGDKQRIAELLAAIRPSSQNLSQWRLQLLDEAPSTPWIVPGNTAGMPRVDYWDVPGISRANPGIKSFSINVRSNEFSSILQKTYYDYSSNDCESVITNSKGTENLIKYMYNASCVNSILLAQKPVELNARRRNIEGFESGPKERTTGNIRLGSLRSVSYGIVDTVGDVHANNVTIVPIRCRSTYAFDNDWSKHVDSIPLYDEVFTVNTFWSTQFYHTTLESLPRLVPFVSFLKDNPSIKIHIGHYNQYLSLLGFPEERIVSGRVRGKVVYVPPGKSCGNPGPLSTQILSSYLRQASPSASTSADTVILIQRSLADKAERTRYFAHHDDIWESVQIEARRRNLHSVVFSDHPLPSLSATVKLFKRAVAVVSPHGAGAANMLLSRPGTLLLEGLHPASSGHPNTCFIAFAQALGFHYHGVFHMAGLTNYSAQDFAKPLATYLDERELL